METARKPNLEIYTEMTPNPDSLKFVMNKMLLPNHSVDYRDEDSARQSPLAMELFGFPFVNGVFISNNFVTITKPEAYQWEDLIPTLKKFLKDYVNEGKDIIDLSGAAPKSGNAVSEDDDEIVAKIKQLLETYVKPAVESDGGAIQYKHFESGTLTLVLHGACSGCPSSMVTLKAGIEGMMKRMIPEVQEVVAEEG